MEYSYLKQQVEKFWAGECSEQEESTLREYFRYQSEIPEEFNSTKEYLGMLGMEENGLNLDFDKRVLSIVEAEKNRVINWRRIITSASVAAVLAIGVFTMVNSENEPNTLIAEDTYENPEQAFLEVKKALIMVSNKINKGKSYSKELTNFNAATDQIQAQ